MHVKTAKDANIVLRKQTGFLRFESISACCNDMLSFMEQSNEKNAVFIDFLRTGRIVYPTGMLPKELNPRRCMYCGNELRVYVDE